MQTNVILIKLGGSLMSFNLHKSKSAGLSQIKIGSRVFTSPGDKAEAFNNHCTNIGQSLAREIPSVDTDPRSCVNPV